MINMIQQNGEGVEKNLQEDLNILIKNLRIHEDMYLTLLQYNKNIITNVDQIQQKSFLTDEIQKHRNFLSLTQAEIFLINSSQLQIKQKYLRFICCDFGEVKLLGRMSARVLQICQSYVELTKCLDDGIVQRFNVFKSVLLGGFNENGKVNVEAMLNVIIQYGNGKYLEEVQRLDKIMIIIGQGDFREFASIYAPNFKNQKNEVKNELEEQEKNFSRPQIIRKKRTEQQVQEQRKKQEEQRIIVQKIKRKKAKVVKELIDNMSQVMDLAKQNMVQSYEYCSNIQEKRIRLYQQLWLKNKFNYHQIVEFQQKKQDLAEKIKRFQQNLQQNKNSQAILSQLQKKVDKKLPIRQVLRKLIRTDSSTGKNQIITPTPEVPEETERLLRKRDFKLHTKTNSIGYAKDSAFSSMQQIHEGLQNLRETKGVDLIAKSARYAKLPQIPIKTSFQYLCEQKNFRTSSQKKEQKRINIAKNVEIGFEYLAANKISCIHKNFTFESSTLKNRNISVEPHVNNFVQSSPKIIRGGFEQNFNVWKKMESFYEN